MPRRTVDLDHADLACANHQEVRLDSLAVVLSDPAADGGVGRKRHVRPVQRFGDPDLRLRPKPKITPPASAHRRVGTLSSQLSDVGLHDVESL